MKNLFTHQVLPDDDESYVPFENPYLISRVSPEVEAMMGYDDEEDDKPKLSDEEKAEIKAKEKKYLLAILISFAFTLFSFLAVNRIESLADTPLMLVPAAGAIAMIVFLYLFRRLQWKKNGTNTNDLNDIDFQAMAERIDEASKAARSEMQIPDDDVSVEILPFTYKMKGDKQIPEKKTNQFDNSPMSMFVKNDRLCIFDGVGLYEIPLGDIKGYRTYDVDYRIDFWLKDDEPTEEKYAAYKIKKCGILEYKTHTYYGVEVVSEATGEAFEMLVPGYDLDELKKVIDVEALA